MAKDIMSNQSSGGKDNFTVQNVLPVAENVAGGNYVKVMSLEQNSIRCNIPHKHYDVIIFGRHTVSTILQYVPEVAQTNVLEEDWNYIVSTTQYGQHPSWKHGRIYVEKNLESALARAKETKELSKKTGSAQLTEENLTVSDRKGAESGVSDVAIKTNIG
jgi:hypothetical protein